MVATSFNSQGYKARNERKINSTMADNANGLEGTMDGHLQHWPHNQQNAYSHQQKEVQPQRLYQTTSMYNKASSTLSGFVSRAAFAAAKSSATGQSNDQAMLDFVIKEVRSVAEKNDMTKSRSGYQTRSRATGVHSQHFAAQRTDTKNAPAGRSPPDVSTLQLPIAFVVGMLKPYFAVDDHYVKEKLKRVLMPFLSTDWKRMTNRRVGDNTPIKYQPPRLDVDAPDLYIPLMSLATFCLLCSVAKARGSGEFDPQFIADIMIKCIGIWASEVLFFRIVGFSLMLQQVPGSCILDMFSYTGYKFCGLTVNSLFGLLFGWDSTAYSLSVAWTVTAMTLFLFKSNHSKNKRDRRSNREIAIVVASTGVTQIVSALFISPSSFL